MTPRSRARAIAVPIGARSASLRVEPLWHAFAARFRADLAVEAESGRLVLWLPVAFTTGILAYFGAAHEPSLAAALALTLALAAATWAARRQAVLCAILAGLCAFSTGFSAGCVRTSLMMHEALASPPAFPIRLSGYVERVERRVGSDRILLRLDPGPIRGIEGPPPRLVRLSLKRGSAPEVGAHITQLVRLLPPLGPAMAGAHDFGRATWFQGIDAVGFGLGPPKLSPAPVEIPIQVRLSALVGDIRAALGARIRAVLHGTPAEIAVALVAGDRSAILPQVEESMRVSGLTHVLSISGLHMALVAGTLFALARGVLALVPALALGWPIKATAALLAISGSAFYLVLSGNDVPAQRSFVMTGLVLAGVLAGRRALTLRTIAVAAVVVLGLTPEAALDPGPQMSFAATLALVAAYERLQPLRALPRPEGLPARILMLPLVFVAGTVVTALVAGFASGPYGAFHFQRFAPYGVLANLVAMPAVSLLVMPFGLLGVLLMPFGWDGLAWPVMGAGIEIMVAVSDRVAALPGADARIYTVNTAALLWFTMALLALCLLRGLPSLLAVPALAVAILVSGAPPAPDVLVAPNAAAVAVRSADGRLSVIGAKGQKMMVEQWLAQEGARRTVNGTALEAGFTCDPLGCVAPLPGGGTLAVSRKPEGLAADCLNAKIVVTQEAPPRGCPARVLTPKELERTGTIAFFLEQGALREQPARDPAVHRPWMPPPAAPRMPEGRSRGAEVDDAASE
ncbi:ComEC/Rec2 family competence protein [Xanthobacter sediminis]|uniref:ComEC/Rec2 family competence protein n=1 Tax=Xanthobacter sediminis TaxID=3119926 RepID=UPI00372B41EF